MTTVTLKAPAKIKHRVEIYTHEITIGAVAHIGQKPRLADSGAVYENVAISDLFYQLGNLIFVAKIALIRDCPRLPFYRFCRLFVFIVLKGRILTPCRKKTDARLADSAAAACNKNFFHFLSLNF